MTKVKRHKNKQIEEHQVKRLNYIGQFIKELRLNQGLTQIEFSDTNDLARNTTQKAEYGGNITLMTLFKIIDANEISLEDFFQEME